jgi:AraC-like DNA-binding protein
MHEIIEHPVLSSRKKEITKNYIDLLDKHIRELKEGRIERAYEIRDFAALMHLHPVHLSNTIKEVTGQSTCELYEERLVKISKQLLLTTDLSVAQISRQLTYDPSNFTKFFKHFTGTTPKKYRDQHSTGEKT